MAADATHRKNFCKNCLDAVGKPPYHNAGLHSSSMTKRSCNESVNLHYQAGVPYDKIVLGIPFYGHGNGVEFTSESVDYKDIPATGYTKRWDSIAMVPYLVNSSGTMVLSYDDETSVGMKADYVKSRGLKGAMYWNIEADDASWTLSKAISTRLLDEAPQAGQTYLVTNQRYDARLPAMWVEEDPDTYLHIRTQEGSFVAACKYLWNFGSETFAGCIEKYLLTIGVSQQDIDDIRKAMLP